MGAAPQAALARPAPGERTISNAEVPLPRSPLSLAGGTAHREPLPVVFAANRGFSPRGCKGRSPLHEITLIPPLPAGKGVGGMGERNQAKGRAGGRGRRRTLHLDSCVARSVSAAGGLMPGCRGRSPRRNKVIFSPFPPGRGSGGWGQESKLKTGLAGDKKGKPPAWHLIGRGCKRRAGSAPGDARGEAPCIKITLVSPFPTGEGGWGDRGAEKKVKAG